MERKTGYYWCRKFNSWDIYYWDKTDKSFYEVNYELAYAETFMREIDENKIVRK